MLPLNVRCRNIIHTQKGSIMLRTAHKLFARLENKPTADANWPHPGASGLRVVSSFKGFSKIRGTYYNGESNGKENGK